MRHKENLLFFCFIFGVLVLQFAHCLGPKCLRCSRIPYPRDCDHVTQCGRSEVCVTKLILTESGHQQYETGCQATDACQSKRRNARDATRNNASDVLNDELGDLIVCEECCEGDFCNSKGCGAQALPELSERGPECFNCHQQSGVDSCESVKVCSETQLTENNIYYTLNYFTLLMECFLTKTYTGTGDVLYETGCRNKDFCRALEQIPQLHSDGKRGMEPLCTGCCNTDYCNQNCGGVSSLTGQHISTTSTTPIPVTTPRTKPTTMRPTTKPTTKPTTIKPTTTKPTTTHKPTVSKTTARPTSDPTSLNKQVCDDLGYTYVDSMNVCYKLYPYPLTWAIAKSTCAHAGGDLLSIQSDKEDIFFQHLAERFNPNYQTTLHSYWISANDITKEGYWEWGDGSNVNRAWFRPGEPNNHHLAGFLEWGHYTEEDCGTLSFFPGDTNWGINDDNCNAAYQFFCEVKVGALATAAITTLRSHCRNADYTYSQETGTCYKIYNRPTDLLNQSEARAKCQKQQADLLILKNIQYESYFQQKHFYYHNGHHRYWLGGVRTGPTSFEWYNGQPLDSHLQWTPREPNNDGGHEDCMTFYYNYNTLGLNDDVCSTKYYFICEERCPDLSYTFLPALQLCVKLHEEVVTWHDARAHCLAEKAELAEPDTPLKLEFLAWFINSTSHGNGAVFWVGGNDVDNDHTFNWVNSGDVITENLWHKGEPSSQGDNEHCAGIWDFGNVTLKLNDAPCNYKSGFICQYLW